MRRAAPPPSSVQDRSSPMPSFMVLDCNVDLAELDKTPPPEWENIYCSSKKAYGCGIYGRKLVEGLALYVHRDEIADLTSSLSIRLSHEARMSIRAELGDPNGRLQAKGAVTNLCQQLLVILVMFCISNGRSKHIYCLVFDSTDASLCLIPFIPSPLEPCFMPTVIPFRAASEKDHELTLMVRDNSSTLGCYRLCVCTPETRANSASDRTGLWKVTEEIRFPRLSSPPFKVDVMFSIKGKVFWGDLSQGVAYCDLGAANSALKFNFIKLPKAYRIYWDFFADEPGETPKMSRTMGCVGDSIRFVCIDRSHPGPGNEMVKMLTLDLDHGRWKESKGVLWKELWKKVNFMRAELRDVVPQYPTLMPDGALCLLCKNVRRQKRGEPDFIGSFDMRSKCLLSAGSFVGDDTMGYLVTPYNFFTMCVSPPLRKRKLPSHARELPALKKKKLPSHERELPTHKRKPQTIVKETPRGRASAAQQGSN